MNEVGLPAVRADPVDHRTLASFRNLALGVIRLNQIRKIKETLERVAADRYRALPLLVTACNGSMRINVVSYLAEALALCPATLGLQCSLRRHLRARAASASART